MSNYKIFGGPFEDEAMRQFESAMDLPYVVQGALMPDAHTGYSLPIGAVVATDGMVMPSWVGYDIGCGMLAMCTTFDANEVRLAAYNIYEHIMHKIPLGFNHHKDPMKPDKVMPGLTVTGYNIAGDKGMYKQLGTLGGGNHFIEIGSDLEDRVWIIIHSGSRGIGHGIATYYMRLASGDGKAREGHFGFQVDSPEGQSYLKDQEFCTEFALENRLKLVEQVLYCMQQHVPGGGTITWINRNHNHVVERDGMWIHRKGATHAEEGMFGVIPGNMQVGSYIVKGLGNPDALWSSSHGAGRALSRKQARTTLDMGQFAEMMDGIVAPITKERLDESPLAYKNLNEVMLAQGALVTIVNHVTPIINVKG